MPVEFTEDRAAVNKSLKSRPKAQTARQAPLRRYVDIVFDGDEPNGQKVIGLALPKGAKVDLHESYFFGEALDGATTVDVGLAALGSQAAAPDVLADGLNITALGVQRLSNSGGLVAVNGEDLQITITASQAANGQKKTLSLAILQNVA